MRPRTSSNRNLDRSGPSCSAIVVEPATSAKSAATIRRSPAGVAMGELYAGPRPRIARGARVVANSVRVLRAAERALVERALPVDVRDREDDLDQRVCGKPRSTFDVAGSGKRVETTLPRV